MRWVFGVDESVSVSYSRKEWPSKGESQIFGATTAVMFGFTYQDKIDYELFVSKSS